VCVCVNSVDVLSAALLALALAHRNYLKLGQGVAGFIGFCASAVSDTCSNSIRVLKTAKQTSEVAISYRQAFNQVVAKDGVSGVFFRGLQTKIISNGFQGLLFNVLWRTIQDAMAENDKKK